MAKTSPYLEGSTLDRQWRRTQKPTEYEIQAAQDCQITEGFQRSCFMHFNLNKLNGLRLLISEPVFSVDAEGKGVIVCLYQNRRGRIMWNVQHEDGSSTSRPLKVLEKFPLEK